MFAIPLHGQWTAWVDALAKPLHRRSAWRLPYVIIGILLAHGRRTVSSWWRAAAVGKKFRSYYYFLDTVGRKSTAMAAVVFGLLRDQLDSGNDRWLLAIDDTPTQRYGPKVQGAGVHHNPSPGPAESSFLYGHNWVVLHRLVDHPECGTIGLPVLGRLYIRKKDVPDLPRGIDWTFKTKPQIAAEMITWAGTQLSGHVHRPWVTVDGGYANREFLKPAQRAGFVVVARLRRDAELYDLPRPAKSGERRKGRPPIYGKNRLSLAKRAGQTRGWQTVDVVTTAGQVVRRKVKTFVATWAPAGGAIRVVIVKADDGSWWALLCTDPDASVEEIVQAAADRWGEEQNFHDLKEVEAIEQVQLRRVWSNVGALNLNLWVHTLVELWAWKRPVETLRDRSDSPWDDPDRRPSHADRRKALRRAMLEQGFQQAWGHLPLPPIIGQLLDRVARMAA